MKSKLVDPVKMFKTSPKEGNRRLASVYYGQIMNDAKIEKIPTILGDDFTFTIPTHPEVFRGIKGFEEEVTGLHGAFPDVHLDVHHKWVFDDLILGLWTGTGTHIGSKPLSTPAGPLPATGNAFKIEGVSWIAADGKQLKENLANEDTLRIIHDLGVKDSTSLYSAASASLVQECQFPAIPPQAAFDGNDLMASHITLNHPLLSNEAFGAAQVSSFFKTYWSAFTEVDLTITQSKQGPGVNAYRWHFEAKHIGKFFGVAATGKRIHHQGVTICLTNTSGQIEKMYINENLIVLLGQLETGA